MNSLKELRPLFFVSKCPTISNVLTIAFWCGFAIATLEPCWSTVAAEPSGDGDQMRSQLQAFLDGILPPEKLEITYSDLHGLYGGLRMCVHGSGKVDQEVVRREAPEPQRLSPDAVRELVKLLIEQEAWKQKVPDAVLIPDESRATLKIVAGDASSMIWERARELKSNDRLIRLSMLMQKLAWTADKEIKKGQN